MESVINVVEGDELAEGKCQFCDKKATHIFGVADLDKKRYNGYPFKGFKICKDHLGALNSLLDGTKDINTLVKNYDRIITGRGLNLRA